MRRPLWTAARNVLLVVAGCGLTVAFVALGWVSQPAQQGSPEQWSSPVVEPAYERIHDRIERMIERRECWTNETGQPRDVLYPSRVWLTAEEGERPTLVGGQITVDRALTQELGGEQQGWNVHAFCK